MEDRLPVNEKEKKEKGTIMETEQMEITKHEIEAARQLLEVAGFESEAKDLLKPWPWGAEEISMATKAMGMMNDKMKAHVEGASAVYGAKAECFEGDRISKALIATYLMLDKAEEMDQRPERDVIEKLKTVFSIRVLLTAARALNAHAARLIERAATPPS